MIGGSWCLVLHVTVLVVVVMIDNNVAVKSTASERRPRKHPTPPKKVKTLGSRVGLCNVLGYMTLKCCYTTATDELGTK